MDEQEGGWCERGLKKAVLAGDEQAWRFWYDQTCDDLYRYVLWRCGGMRDHADEVLQDVWLTAVRRLRDFDPEEAPFLAWLRGIAANLLRNRFRREMRQSPPPLVGEGQGEPADAELLRREQAELVAAALARLPERYEWVLRARYLDGLPVATIARERGESFKTVESLLARARDAFRTTYDRQE